MQIKVGCCGFSVKGGRKAYYRLFDLVEIQSTFYQLPNTSTAMSWRREAPEGFEFTLKAWQAVTHPLDSPTWRRARWKPPVDKASSYGLLKPTEENLEAWDMIVEIARILRSRVVVVQCPPSFQATEESVSDLKAFFNKASTGGLIVAWEPRHSSWTYELVRSICLELGLIHIVDPFKERCATEDVSPVYYRLHGLGSRPYVYKYTDDDLRILYEKYVRPLIENGLETYILWNNIYMAQDAERFKQLYLKAG
ncbi:MAG: DUF72 domain-containing protein [Candidatus Bathyarchaeia archaeon]|nr:DUF72 domain-containing protein [Candidatus Bathyarchaeota archaeon]